MIIFDYIQTDDRPDRTWNRSMDRGQTPPLMSFATVMIMVMPGFGSSSSSSSSPPVAADDHHDALTPSRSLSVSRSTALPVPFWCVWGRWRGFEQQLWIQPGAGAGAEAEAGSGSAAEMEWN